MTTAKEDERNAQASLPARVRRLVEQCACCRARLVPEMRVVIVGGKFASWSPQVEELRGQVIEVRTPRVAHTLAAVAPRAGTSAHAAGYDVLFVVCSRACRDTLDEALRGEVIRLARQRPQRDGPDARRVN